MGDLTLKRLGKLVALSIRWPRLFAELSEEPQVFNSLQTAAASPTITDFAQYWSLYPGLHEFLSEDGQWSLSSMDLSIIVNVSPNVNVRYSIPALEQLAREYEATRAGAPIPSTARTDRLLVIVLEVRKWARANTHAMPPLPALASGSDGERVVAFVLAEITRDPSVVGIAVDNSEFVIRARLVCYVRIEQRLLNRKSEWQRRGFKDEMCRILLKKKYGHAEADGVNVDLTVYRIATKRT